MKSFGILAVLVAMVVSMVMFLRPGASPDAPTAQNAPAIIEKAQHAVEVADLSALKRVLETYKADKGNYPASLEQLKDEGFIDRVPGGVNYDPATGEVTPAP